MNTQDKGKYRWFSLLLSLCVPGLGQFAAGRPWRALVWFALIEGVQSTLVWLAILGKVTGIVWPPGRARKL